MKADTDTVGPDHSLILTDTVAEADITPTETAPGHATGIVLPAPTLQCLFTLLLPRHPTFDKTAIDLVTECKTSNSGNKHILTIIAHLTGSSEAFPIPNKSTYTIVSTFINQYLPVHVHPRYILSDNGTEFKNNLMEQVLKQLGIERIFSAPYHPQSNGKLEVFHKYLKPTLRKLCEKDPSNWDKYISQVLASYRVTPNLATAETSFFFVYGREPNYTSSPASRACAMLFGRSRLWNDQP